MKKQENRFRILKNGTDLMKKGKQTLKTQAMSRKDQLQDATDVILPPGQNADETKDRVRQNKR